MAKYQPTPEEQERIRELQAARDKRMAPGQDYFRPAPNVPQLSSGGTPPERRGGMAFLPPQIQPSAPATLPQSAMSPALPFTTSPPIRTMTPFEREMVRRREQQTVQPSAAPAQPSAAPNQPTLPTPTNGLPLLQGTPSTPEVMPPLTAEQRAMDQQIHEGNLRLRQGEIESGFRQQDIADLQKRTGLSEVIRAGEPIVAMGRSPEEIQQLQGAGGNVGFGGMVAPGISIPGRGFGARTGGGVNYGTVSGPIAPGMFRTGSTPPEVQRQVTQNLRDQRDARALGVPRPLVTREREAREEEARRFDAGLEAQLAGQRAGLAREDMQQDRLDNRERIKGDIELAKARIIADGKPDKRIAPIEQRAKVLDNRVNNIDRELRRIDRDEVSKRLAPDAAQKQRDRLRAQQDRAMAEMQQMHEEIVRLLEESGGGEEQSQERVVNSEEEAMAQPAGTIVNLNGKRFRVE